MLTRFEGDNDHHYWRASAVSEVLQSRLGQHCALLSRVSDCEIEVREPPMVTASTTPNIYSSIDVIKRARVVFLDSDDVF